MIKHSTIYFTVVLLSIRFFAAAQSTTLNQTMVNLDKQAKALPFEKIYLHMDKPYYAAGDTIWFKAYDLLGPHHRLSLLSNVLNVELINQRGTIVVQNIRLNLTEGTAAGDFALPDTLQEGNYRIRAYTNWMRNAGSDYFFDKTISIVNALSNKVFTQSSYTYSIQNNQQTINSTINYADLDGKPYAGKQVKYEVRLDPERVARGEGMTDEKGNLHIAFTNPTPDMLSTGQIITSITIDNQKAVNKIIAVKATSGKVDVQFFPESGSLINGLISKVAFKAISADGFGVDIKGAIVDESNTEITRFESMHLGMGAFMLAPQPGKTYKANVTHADGTTQTIDLPKAQDKGYVLSIDDKKDSLNIIVKITGTGYDNQQGGVTLVAQSGGEVYLQGQGQPGKTNFTAMIDRKKLPSGVIQFTLFSDTGEPLNERLVFVQNPDNLKLDVNTASQTYTSRQKVKVDFNAKSPDGQAAQGNFSIAVIDENKVPVDETTESNILSNILLTSDIKGYIEKPNYYFNNPTEKTRDDLDVLMMTQGYHRFEWKQIMSGTLPNIVYRPEKAIVISGQVKKDNNKPASFVKVTLMSNSAGFFAVDTVTDKDGRFAFNGDYPDSIRFTIQALLSGSDEQLKVVLDNTIPPFRVNKNAADVLVSVNNGLEAYLQNSKLNYEAELKYGIGNHNIVLNAVNINTTRVKTQKEITLAKAVEFSSNLNGKGAADQVVTSEVLEGKGCSTLEYCLDGLLVGVIWDANTHIPYLFRAASDLKTGQRWPMHFIIDGIFVGWDEVAALDINSISSIEVLKSGGYLAIYGSRAAGGVMIFTTKHGPGFIADAKSSSSTIQPRGFYRIREFYSPKYDNPKINPQIPDLRTTIFWEPGIKTDAAGNASFEYFNGDGKGTYRVVVEGVDYQGNIGRKVYRYTVQ